MVRALILAAVFAALPLRATGQEAAKAPALTLKTVEGRTLRLSDYRGKVVLLNFWATWCPPCRAEVPDLIRYQREYAKDGLQIVGVTYPPETRARVRRFVKRLRVNYPVALGTRRTKALFSADEALPLTVVIGRDGGVRAVIPGILLPEEFDEQVRPLLRGPRGEAETNARATRPGASRWRTPSAWPPLPSHTLPPRSPGAAAMKRAPPAGAPPPAGTA